jgi:hypothetical protein
LFVPAGLLKEVGRNIELIAIRDVDTSLVEEGNSGLLFEECAERGIASKVFKFGRILEDGDMILMDRSKEREVFISASAAVQVG